MIWMAIFMLYFPYSEMSNWYKQLLSLLEYSHDCRRLYYECHDRLKEKGLILLQRAYCFLVIANLGFQGMHPLVTRSYIVRTY